MAVFSAGTSTKNRQSFAKDNIMLYRNWPLIATVKDFFLRLALCFANLETDEGKALAAAFTECFTAAPVKNGPVPLSSIVRAAQEEEPELAPPHNTGVSLVIDVPKVFEIPVFKYAKHIDCATAKKIPMLPERIDKEVEFGNTVEINGKSFVVLDNTSDSMDYEFSYMLLAPAECIMTDI
jgi:hypothetical protein